MNQVFAGATALIIALLLWGLGKKPKGSLIGNIHQQNLKGLNLQEITLVSIERDSIDPKLQRESKIEKNWLFPKTIQERINLQKQLHKLISGGPNERLKAINLSGQWGHITVLPILRRGLKDSNSQVVIAAAAALEKHRRAPHSKLIHENGTRRPPRNVALMR